MLPRWLVRSTSARQVAAEGDALPDSDQRGTGPWCAKPDAELPVGTYQRWCVV